MKKNIGLIDKVVRLSLVATIAILYATHLISGGMALALGLVAVIFLLTSLAGTCLIYLPFGLSTRKS